MSIEQASWIHGTSLELENKTWTTFRQGFFTTVRPSWQDASGWVHFAIPTPVIVKGKRLKVQSALLRFTTGPKASIGAIHVYDGEKKILDHNGTSYTGNFQTIREIIPGTPEVLYGTGISVYVNFNGTCSDAYIQFIGAGIDFY